MKLYLIEDDLNIGQALLSVFKGEGHEVVWVRMAGDAVERLQAEDFDAVLLDLGLPDGDGSELLQRLRAAGVNVPVLVITARDGLRDRLRAFDNGADDYLIKPFEIPELLVRLRAILRRAGAQGDLEATWNFGNLVLEEKRMRVTLDVHISNLRKKIGDGHIRTVRGVGYMMQGDAGHAG